MPSKQPLETATGILAGSGEPVPEQQLYGLPRVMSITSRCRAAIYADKSFPRPIKLSPRRSAWIAAEVHAWINERVRLSRDPGSASAATEQTA